MNRHKFITSTICIILIIVISSTSVTPLLSKQILNLETNSSVKGSRKKSIEEKITLGILFDTNDPSTVKTTTKMKDLLRKTGISVSYSPVSSLEDLKQEIYKNYEIIVYIFHGTTEGILLGTEVFEWSQIKALIKASPSKNHIFEVCNSLILENSIKGKNIHGIESVIDAELAVIDSLVQILTILESSTQNDLLTISSKIRLIAGEYFITNLAELMIRALVPLEPLSGDVLTINLTSDDALVRGPWGWLTRMLLSGWLDKTDMNGDTDWYDVSDLLGVTRIDVNKSQVNSGGLKATKEIKKSNLGSGDSSTGTYPFDIPLNLEITPKMGSGPWYFPEYVDLNMGITTAKLDLAKATGLDKIMEAAGYNVKLTLDPSLWGGLRVGNYAPEIGQNNPFMEANPVTFLGGGLTIKLHFEIGIPLATFLDYIIPGSGKTISSILKILNIRVDLLNVLDLLIGMGYNATTQSSMEKVLLKVGIGFLIDAKLPSFKSLIKKAIGLDIPLGFLQLGMKLRGTTGLAASAEFGPQGDSFKVGLFYNVMFKFWVKLFWFLKFGWENTWDDTIWLIELIGDPKNPPTDEHVNLDLDSDGLWDHIEPTLGLNNKSQDTDNDGLSDGMEINEFYTNPLLNDSDGDKIIDGTEVAEFYKLGLNPLADYDNDGLHCLLDSDSDNDGLDDRQEIYGLPYDFVYSRFTKTNPSLVDTDWDKLPDGQEFMWTDPQREENHTDPLTADTDGDGMKDGDEFEYYTNNPAGHDWPGGMGIEAMDTIDFLLDSDSDNDLLNDGIEKIIGTDPLDFDTDGDYDTNNNGIIESGELLPNPDYPSYPGNLTDYGEFVGNYWPGGPFDADGPCNEPWPIPTNPLSIHSDNDTIDDNAEWLASTKPVQFDADGDGISNENEHDYFKTICNDSDTDNDGLYDGFELNLFRGLGYSDSEINTSGFLRDPDVDDDGLMDGIEYFLETLILDNDTDDDNYLDGAEFLKGTFIKDPDTDNDGLLDGDEVLIHNTDPFNQDSDKDGLTDYIEVNEQAMYILNIGRVDGIFTDPNDPDTDDDGISDGEEVYGWHWAIDRRLPPGGDSDDFNPVFEVEGDNTTLIPYYTFPDPYRARFQTNPIVADTDGDSIIDGIEKEMTLSPLTADTDGDKLSDFDEFEIMANLFGTDDLAVLPDIWHYLDYDGDGLSDWDEHFNGTLILATDSDSDGLSDWEEISMPVTFSDSEVERDEFGNATISANATGTRRYTEPMNPDTDEDGLIDGDEINEYGTDPTDPDTDHDGLTDKQELIDYEQMLIGIDGTYYVHPDPNNPDSDSDGIFDGDEVIIFTDRQSSSGDPKQGPLGDFDNDALINILDYDSDNDGIVDGLEVFNYTQSSWFWYPIGSNPFNADQDSNSVLDGYQTDYDLDELSDYTETILPAPGYSQPVILKVNGVNSANYQHIVNHTLFLLADTDNDGYEDGFELTKYFTDPLDPISAPVINIENLELSGTHYQVDISTHSEIFEFAFLPEEKSLEFMVSGEDGTSGFCEITIPRTLLDASTIGEWDVYMDDELHDFELRPIDNTNVFYFTYNHSVHHFRIVGDIVEGFTSSEIPITESTTSTTEFLSSNTEIPSETSTPVLSWWLLFTFFITAVTLRKRSKEE